MMVTAAGSMHPTGMHSCQCIIFFLYLDTFSLVKPDFIFILWTEVLFTSGFSQTLNTCTKIVLLPRNKISASFCPNYVFVTIVFRQLGKHRSIGFPFNVVSRAVGHFP